MNSNLLMEFFSSRTGNCYYLYFQTLYRHLRMNLIHITLKTDIYFCVRKRILFPKLSISFWHPRFSPLDKNMFCFSLTKECIFVSLSCEYFSAFALPNAKRTQGFSHLTEKHLSVTVSKAFFYCYRNKAAEDKCKPWCL